MPLWTTENSQLGSDLECRISCDNLSGPCGNAVPVRMAIEARWGAVGGPSRVCNASVRIEDLSQVGLLLLDELLQLGNLAHLLEGHDLILPVTIYGQTGRVIATVLEPGEAIDEGVEDELPVLLDKVVNVAKNTTTKKGVVSSDTQTGIGDK